MLTLGICAVLSAMPAEAFQMIPLRSMGGARAGTFLVARNIQCRPLALGASLCARRRGAGQVQMNQQQAQDALINKLADVSPLDLPSAASQSIKEVSNPAFFMRIATLSDESSDEAQKAKLAGLASNLVAALEVVVERTEERMDDSAEVVQQVLAAAAEADGQFELPLKPERVEAMRAALLERRQLVDEGVLSCLFAYMKKAGEDQLDGMVSIFQTMLQQWAAIEVLEAKPANAMLEAMLQQGPDNWDAILKQGVTSADDKDAVLTAIQSCVEKVVLQKASGSYGQRVQAEFLREMMARIRDV